MSGGSQHNPNGRQAQLGAGWSPMQFQMAGLLQRAPQAHMASERGVTWHTPTPPHLYHVPAPSPPDPLQAMKMGAGAANSVFRHTATPPELYRHTPTPPDKHLMRHTPSPGDIKAGVGMPPADLFPHLGPARGPPRSGVDLSVPRSNGSALSVRDAPTINSLIARAAPRHRVDQLLERLSPHSVIVHGRAHHTPSPPSSNEDSVDSTGAPSCKRKRKPERTTRLPAPPPHAYPPSDTTSDTPADRTAPPEKAQLPQDRVDQPSIEQKEPERIEKQERLEEKAPESQGPDKNERLPSPVKEEVVEKEKPVENGEVSNGPRLCSPELPAAAPRRAGPAPQPSPSEALAAEPRADTPADTHVDTPAETCTDTPADTPDPIPASIVDVEDQLEKMFAGIEEEKPAGDQPADEPPPPPPLEVLAAAPKRRKSTKGAKKASRRSSRASTDEGKKKPGRKKATTHINKKKLEHTGKDAYDSGSNASSGKSRGPYVQVRGPGASPSSVCVVNLSGAQDDEWAARGRRGAPPRGLHASTLGPRYDAATRDVSWVCAFCGLGPHAQRLGDLFGPYEDVWAHEDCAVWAPGLVAAGARLFGLQDAVAAVAAQACDECGRPGAAVPCAGRACRGRVHVPCARASAGWQLLEDSYRAFCADHCAP